MFCVHPQRRSDVHRYRKYFGRQVRKVVGRKEMFLAVTIRIITG
jgi:hypothetical protein